MVINMVLTQLQSEEYSEWKRHLVKIFNVELVLKESYDPKTDETHYFRFSDMLKRLDVILGE